GSIYVLVIIAGLDLQWVVSKLIGKVPWEIGKMLRGPESSKTLDLIKNQIIPIITLLSKMLPLQLDALCGPQFREMHGLPSFMDVSDLVVSDMCFDAFKSK
ncbi:hypothetical protein F4604DRAFT_1581475, partial [Suillus subluteus]